MPEPNALLLLLLVVCGGLLVSSQMPTKPNFMKDQCDDFIDDYDINSEHSFNLQNMMAELQMQAFITSFYNGSAGAGLDKVYGQYYCRTDIDSDLCRQCITEASSKICTGAINVIVWYEECTLRYNNMSSVGVYEPTGSNRWADVSSIMVEDTDNFGTVLGSTLDRIKSMVLNGSGSVYQATGEGVVSESDTVYCLVQCSPDLSLPQCDSCLSNARFTVSVIERKPMGWPRLMSIFESSCQIRYSNYGAFYRLTPTALSPGFALPPLTPEASRVTGPKGKKASYYVIRAVIAAAVIGSLIILGISLCLIRQRYRVQKPTTGTAEAASTVIAEREAETTDFVQFDLKTIEAATNTFSVSNKLGQGGFGIVYQGMLNNGQAIAVKRLSQGSAQGTIEFKTEVGVLAKLQHKNLVQLVGCCIDGEERLLVYEFLCNLSLDRFLFDASRSAYLTWEIRHKIIQGIARGLHYLHEDLRVKIVHRDLKTSNILLDDKLDPKIADFGMARLVKVDQTAGNTTKVVGTYGYMSPEYALAGRYSTKSDVYSFGVIVLEILSGKSNNMFYDISHSKGLLQHAWRLWNGGAIEQLMDPIIQNSYSRIEAERCLQIGLLCVQDDATCRPTMHAVLIMLNSNTIDLPSPVSPSHYNYINTLSSGEETQESFSKQQEEGSGLSSSTFISDKDLYAR